MCCRCQGHSFSNHLWTNVFLCLLSSRYSECLCYLYKTKWRQVVYLWKPIQIFSGMCGVKSMHYPSWIYLVTNWYICLFQTVLTFTWWHVLCCFFAYWDHVTIATGSCLDLTSNPFWRDASSLRKWLRYMFSILQKSLSYGLFIVVKIPLHFFFVKWRTNIPLAAHFVSCDYKSTVARTRVSLFRLLRLTVHQRSVYNLL